jgi:hypothetical protein
MTHAADVLRALGQFGPTTNAEEPTPLDATPAEERHMRAEMARAAKRAADYARGQSESQGRAYTDGTHYSRRLRKGTR